MGNQEEMVRNEADYSPTSGSDVVYADGNVSFDINELGVVADRFGLGRIIGKPQVESGGTVNYNFRLVTDRGNYVVRGKNGILDEKRIERKELERAVTDHLRAVGFEFDVPHFLTNNVGGRFIEIEGKTYEVYERLKGISGDKTDLHNNSDTVGAIAKYHIAMKSFATDTRPLESKRSFDEGNGLLTNLNAMRDRVENSQSEVDSLVKANLPLLFGSYDLLKGSFVPNPVRVVTHNDLHKGNILFTDGRLSGIIDFENVRWNPVEKDLTKLVKAKPEEVDWVVREYRKHNELSDEEAANIIPERIAGSLHSIGWVYGARIKASERRFHDLSRSFDNLRKAREYWNETLRK